MPKSEYVGTTKAKVVARVALDENGEIYFDGAKVDNAKDVEWGVRALLTNTVSDDQRHVQFKCDKSQPKEIFEPVPAGHCRSRRDHRGGGREARVEILRNN